MPLKSLDFFRPSHDPVANHAGFSLQVTHCKSHGLAGVETSVLKFYRKWVTLGHGYSPAHQQITCITSICRTSPKQYNNGGDGHGSSTCRPNMQEPLGHSSHCGTSNDPKKDRTIHRQISCQTYPKIYRVNTSACMPYFFICFHISDDCPPS